MVRLALPLLAVLAARVPPIRAASLTPVTSRGSLGAVDSVNWGQLGGDATAVGQTFSATSAEGDSISGSFAGPQGEVVIEGGPSWIGNFAFGDVLLWTTGNGPLTLSFAAPVSAAGANFEANTFGAFTAEIQAYAGSTLLGSFSENGFADASENGLAIFIGAAYKPGGITRIVLSATAPPGQDFAINSLALQPAPEPGQAALAGIALLGMLALRKNNDAR